MPARDLEHVPKNDLIEELINRDTFVGLVIYHREDAKAGKIDPGEVVVTKSPPLTREGVETLLEIGRSLVGRMFGEEADHAEHDFLVHSDRPPLRIGDEGAVRVGNSRIPLDLVVEQYENGMTPEDIVRAYDTLQLADVYAVIGYYLRHRDEVCAYLKRRGEEAAALQARIESDRPPVSREALLTRRSAREKDRAATGQ